MRAFRRVVTLAAVLVLPLTIAATPLDQPSEDLRESYKLLTDTYYAKVDAQKILDGARDALSDAARKHSLRITLPDLRDAGSSDRNIDAISAGIARVQSATHDAGSDLTYGVIDAMAKSLRDPYTAFFTPDQFRKFNSALDPDKISGIGVLIEPDPATKFVRAYYVVPGTPAERAGLQSGDVFTGIDGKSTHGLTQDDASKMLRGKAGSEVHIQVQRGGVALAPITITRSEVRPPSVIFRMLPQRVAYIWILQFGRETPQEVATALERAQKEDVRAYVIDLRNDGGGYVNSALDISSHFVNGDPLLTIEQRGSHSITVDADGHPVPPRPMALLVNRYTASASEITAGALQDNGVAVLVGEKTFGKGVMQSLTQLPDGAAIKITTAHYLTPKNRDINLRGIQPDFPVVENKDARFGEAEHDSQLQAALTILSKKIAQAKP